LVANPGLPRASKADPARNVFAIRIPELASMRYWHAMPDAWERMDCHKFLAARRPLLAEVIKDDFHN
jgi:hypothetical protein